MVGTRDNWKRLLPIIEAFVANQPVQKKNYNGIWEDTEELHSLLSSEYRIKPKGIKPGIWTITYFYKESAFSSEGIMKVQGSSDTPPKWPSKTNVTYLKESENFVPFTV